MDLFSLKTFSWESQNAIMTSSIASMRLVRRASIRFIILFQTRPKLTDWKSVVLVNTKRK